MNTTTEFVLKQAVTSCRHRFACNSTPLTIDNIRRVWCVSAYRSSMRESVDELHLFELAHTEHIGELNWYRPTVKGAELLLGLLLLE